MSLEDHAPETVPGLAAKQPRNDIEVTMFILQRPIAALMATVATTIVFTVIDLLLRYAAR